MQLPSKSVFTDSAPSTVISGELLTGDEAALITLSLYRDIHMGPGVDPIRTYFEKSVFIDTLCEILIAAGKDLGGAMGILRSEIIDHDALTDVRAHMLESDYTDIIDVSCNEVVPGIFTVCAKIEGETKVSCLRSLDKIVVDRLFVEIVTDYFLLQAGGPASEN